MDETDDFEVPLDIRAALDCSKADMASGRVVPVEDVIRRLRETTARMKAAQSNRAAS